MIENNMQYSLAACVYVCSAVFFAAVRMMHMCKPYNENPGYYYPARHVMSLCMLVSLFTLQYIFFPSDRWAWLELKCLLLMMPLIVWSVALYRYLTHTSHEYRCRGLVLTSVPSLLVAAVVVVGSLTHAHWLLEHEFTFRMVAIVVSVFHLSYVVSTYLWVDRLYDQYGKGNYSNESDFPLRFIKITAVLPVLYCAPVWAVFFTDSQIAMAVVQICLAIFNVWLLIVTLSPQRMSAQDTLVQMAPGKAQPALSASEVDAIGARLQDIIVNQEFFLDRHLELARVAIMIGEPLSKVSYVFQQQFGDFYDYVNKLREARARQYAREHPQATVQEIAANSGFDNFSVMNRESNRLQNECGWQAIGNRLEQWAASGGALKEGVTLDSVAHDLGTNRTYVSRYVNETKEVSFREWISQLRLAAAERMLVETPGKSINEVAYATGFSSPSSFCHTFSSSRGMSPQAWRDGHVPQASFPSAEQTDVSEVNK